LVPFYFLTPVHRVFPVAVAPRPTPTVTALPPTRAPALAPATPPPAEVKQVVGADTAPVAAPTPLVVPTPVPLPTAPPADSRFAILLLGYGGGGHDGAYLTDSMMLVIVDPDRKTLALLSFPRDTWVPILFDGTNPVYNKINTAYAFAQDPSLYPERLDRYTGENGPGLLTADTVARLLGVPVRYYLGLDFTGFRQAIDAIGGIDVNVPTAFAARYPANDDPSIDASWINVRFASGSQHMNGERAIEYARAREVIDDSGEGSDFARSRRQRLIIEAFEKRLFQPGGLIHLPQLIGIGASHVDTNYTVPDAAKLSQLLLDWRGVTIYQSALTLGNYLEEATGPDGTYALVPGSSDHSWADIQEFAKKYWTDPADAAVMAQTTLVVENDTGVPGAAAKLTTTLARLGYSVGDPTSGSAQTQSRLLDANGKLAPNLANLLTKDFPWSSLESATDATLPAAQVVLQLGSADVGLADAVPNLPEASPSSAVGIEKFGIWAPDAAPADVVAPVAPAQSITGTVGITSTSPLRLRTPTRSPVGTGTPEPSLVDLTGSATPAATGTGLSVSPSPTEGTALTQTPLGTPPAPSPSAAGLTPTPSNPPAEKPTFTPTVLKPTPATGTPASRPSPTATPKR
jgi:LCP family protein required for cell wall assembly